MAARSHTVEPSRLAYGSWCHASEKQIGEGDIRVSYSADRIGMGQPVRKPFRYGGELWVCVGTGTSGAEAYSNTIRGALPEVIVNLRTEIPCSKRQTFRS